MEYKDYKGIAEDLTNMIGLLEYSKMDVANANILGFMAAVVREFEDNELDEKGQLEEFSEGAILVDKLEKAFFDRDVEEVFLEMLVDYERFELVAEIKKIWH